MIDLTSKDCTYTSFKIFQIKGLLKKIKPDIKELSSSEVINLAIIFFAYVCESEYVETDKKDLLFTYGSEDIVIDVENLTMKLKFNNKLLNDFFFQVKDNDDMMSDFETVKELVGDENGF